MDLLFFVLMIVVTIFVRKVKTEEGIKILQHFGRSVMDNVFVDEGSRLVFIITHKHSVVVWRSGEGKLFAKHYLIQRVSFTTTLPANKVETELYDKFFPAKEEGA